MNQDLPSGITLSGTQFAVEDVPVECPKYFIEEQTEGPFYKSGSKERIDLVNEKIKGVQFTLTGYVFDKEGKPIKKAWLDFWHADRNGLYDNTGYRLRGHQFTDGEGKYILHTVIPGAYDGRTNHIHVKLSRSHELSLTEAPGSIVTTQLYFPKAEKNKEDVLFRESLVMKMGMGNEGQLIAFFNLKLNQ